MSLGAFGVSLATGGAAVATLGTLSSLVLSRKERFHVLAARVGLGTYLASIVIAGSLVVTARQVGYWFDARIFAFSDSATLRVVAGVAGLLLASVLGVNLSLGLPGERKRDRSIAWAVAIHAIASIVSGGVLLEMLVRWGAASDEATYVMFARAVRLSDASLLIGVSVQPQGTTSGREFSA